MKPFLNCINVVLAVIFLGLSQAAYAVDGVIEINQVKAVAGGVTTGDLAGFPVSITEPGSYRLTGDLTAGSLSGISIQTPHVTLDLNGFSIIGDETVFKDGVLVNAGATADAEIRDGAIRSFGRHGIFSLSTSPGVRVIDVRVVQNSFNGMKLEGEGNLVRGCAASDNSGTGIQALGDSLVINNTIRSNTGFGLRASTGVGYGGNVIAENNGGSANPQVTGAGVEIGTNMCGSDTTCP